MSYTFKIEGPFDPKYFTTNNKKGAFTRFYEWLKESTDNGGLLYFMKRGDYYAVAKILMPNGSYIQGTIEVIA